MSFEVLIDRAAARRLERLPQDILRRIRLKLSQLESNPWPPGCKLLADDREKCWRIRVGKYRILYRVVEDAARVEVYEIDLRDRAYRDR